MCPIYLEPVWEGLVSGCIICSKQYSLLLISDESMDFIMILDVTRLYQS